MNSMVHPAHQRQPRSQDRALALQELREHIGSYLSRSDLGALCQVSKGWHQDWNPLYWKIVHQPKVSTVDFASSGHLIKSLELATTKQPVLCAIRDRCHQLRHLRLTSYKLTPEMFKECIMGSPPVTAAETVQAQETSVQAKTGDIPPALEPCFYRSAYLSNSLHTLNLRTGPEVCEIMLPWLTRAKQAGYLQGLRSFTMAPAVITYTCIVMDPEPERYVKLSDIYAFLDAFPALTAFSTSEMKIINDVQLKYKEVPTSQGASNTTTVNSVASGPTHPRVYPSIISLQLHVGHEALFQDFACRMPNVTKLSVYPAGSSNIIPAIRQHYPGLKMLAVDMSCHPEYYKPFAEADIEGQRREFKDWIDLFQGLPHLESLSTRYTSLPLTVMESLASSCPKLEQLRFGYGTLLSVPGLESLLRSCTQLKDIHVEDQALSASIIANDDLWKSPVETLYLDQGCSCLSARVLLEPHEYALASVDQGSGPITDTDTKATREGSEPMRSKKMDISSNTIAYPCLEKLSIEWFKDPLFSDSSEAFSTMLNHMPCLRSLVLDRDFTEEEVHQVRRRPIPG
ncbi:unnamed protein product [Mortierella alpina]